MIASWSVFEEVAVNASVPLDGLVIPTLLPGVVSVMDPYRVLELWLIDATPRCT